MPPFLLAASAVTSIASSIFSAFGANRAAAAARREGREMAKDAVERSEFDARKYGIDLAQLLGRQRVGMAAQGVDLTQGTAATVRAETERFGAEDIRMIRENAMREAYALRRGRFNQAAQFRQQAVNSAAGAFSTTLSLGGRAWESYNQGAAGRATTAAKNSVFGAKASSTPAPRP